MGDGKKDIKQISVVDSSKTKYRVTQLDKEHFVKEPGINYTKTENFKIPSGYIVVGARIPKKADLYSNETVPICDLIIMKEHGSTQINHPEKTKSAPKIVSNNTKPKPREKTPLEKFRNLNKTISY